MPKEIRPTGRKREKWDTMRDLGSLTWILSEYGTKVKAKNNQTQHTISLISVNSTSCQLINMLSKMLFLVAGYSSRPYLRRSVKCSSAQSLT